MPTVDVAPDELRRLVGRDVDDETLVDDLFGLGLELEGRTDAGEFELEFAPDRLDRLSVEGIARSLRYHYGIDRGVYLPEVTSPEWTAIVDEHVPASRPHVSAFIVRDIDLGGGVLESLIQLQEKLHATMGRRRRKGAIGIHDLTMLKGAAVDGSSKAIRYTGIEGAGDRFVPLESDAEYTPDEVVTDHHIGAEYAHLVADYDSYPAIYDDIGMFSMPPIVNGERTRVTTDTRDILVELTGTDQWTIDRMGAILAYALDARGGQLEQVAIEYENDRLIRPDLETRTKRVQHDRIERVLGVSIDGDAVVDLAERSGLDATAQDDGYEIVIPPYRVDVLHPLDLIDDLGRAYGFNELDARYPPFGTIGRRTSASRLEDSVREQLIGMGFADLLNFHLIGEADTFDRLGIAPGEDAFGAGLPARITEPYSEEYAILRTWALPSLMMVLENNTHRRYPQHLAEIGLVAERNDDEPTGVAEYRTVAAVLAETGVGFEDAKSRVQFLAREHDASLETPSTTHPTFLDGRVADIVIDGTAVGVIGEIHPRVLAEYDLEVPVAAFEFHLDALAD